MRIAGLYFKCSKASNSKITEMSNIAVPVMHIGLQEMICQRHCVQYLSNILEKILVYFLLCRSLEKMEQNTTKGQSPTSFAM
jgi:hypothetical protein